MLDLAKPRFMGRGENTSGGNWISGSLSEPCRYSLPARTQVVISDLPVVAQISQSQHRSIQPTPMNALILIYLAAATQPRIETLPISPFAISEDGSTVVGTTMRSSNNDAPENWQPAKWSRKTGVQRLNVGKFTEGTANSCSGDGKVVVGKVWNKTEVWVAVWYGLAKPVLVTQYSWKYQPWDPSPIISGDGKWVVGSKEGRPFKWSLATGSQFLPEVSGVGHFGCATAISRDGQTITGFAIGKALPNVPSKGRHMLRDPDVEIRVCIWTRAGKGKLIPGVSGIWSFPSGISSDGNTVVGNAWTHDRDTCFIWRRSGGTTKLRDFSNADPIAVHGLNPDGNRLFGACAGPSPKSNFIGTVWVDDRAVSLRNYFKTMRTVGVDKWSDLIVRSTSANAKVWIGNGTTQDGVQRNWILE